MALGAKSAHKAEQEVLCSFLSSLLADRTEANSVRYTACSHHPGVRIPRKVSNSQIFQNKGKYQVGETHSPNSRKI